MPYGMIQNSSSLIKLLSCMYLAINTLIIIARSSTSFRVIVSYEMVVLRMVMRFMIPPLKGCKPVDFSNRRFFVSWEIFDEQTRA